MRHDLHRWDVSSARAVAIQRDLGRQVVEAPLTRPVRLVAGVDCAFLDAGRRILAGAIVYEPSTDMVLETRFAEQACSFPYISGFLSFREAPAVLEALSRLSLDPDIIMCDGQGLAHPRRLGLACHIGLWMDKPTIGVAKSRLCGTHRQPGTNRRCHVSLKYHGQEVGRVVRTRTGVKPLFVSVGHRITLTEAVSWTLRLARKFRLPEPTRLAHIAVTRKKKDIPV